MIIYHVTISLEASIEAQWIEWMLRIHVPEVLRTGCFSRCRIYKTVGEEETGPVYVMQYFCPSLEEYRRYRDNFAPTLQKEHSDRFSGHFSGARQLLEEIATLET